MAKVPFKLGTTPTSNANAGEPRPTAASPEQVRQDNLKGFPRTRSDVIPDRDVGPVIGTLDDTGSATATAKVYAESPEPLPQPTPRIPFKQLK